MARSRSLLFFPIIDIKYSKDYGTNSCDCRENLKEVMNISNLKKVNFGVDCPPNGSRTE